jgi:hypothetical protein
MSNKKEMSAIELALISGTFFFAILKYFYVEEPSTRFYFLNLLYAAIPNRVNTVAAKKV